MFRVTDTSPAKAKLFKTAKIKNRIGSMVEDSFVSIRYLSTDIHGNNLYYVVDAMGREEREVMEGDLKDFCL
ncbi:hypothetical protein 19_00007 [Pseudomonas phage Epa19]|nr:hypothetical protein 19_00007 [Pseudomonas phage Epa19]